ncbi:3-oxoacyl- reductase FabG [Apiospora aurea]|uniref:3-oxoacyl- reductase FabG n=1 Tax=Apiospora aurea TaxID=335848 RepID=A0ABR1QRK7_9PEZI
MKASSRKQFDGTPGLTLCSPVYPRRATAIKLHGLGATLAITDVSQEGVSQTLELCGGGKQHFAQTLDVSKQADVESRVAEIVASLGRIDHVFNCAGINPTAFPLTEVSEEYYDKLMAVNLKGVFSVTRATMPHVTASRGSYVNVSSVLGVRAGAEYATYCATKWGRFLSVRTSANRVVWTGVIGFSKAMALELGPKGVRVNIVAPGYITTPTNAGVAKGTDDAIKEMEQANSLGRMGTPEEIADVVAFLMSDEARYMNGSVVEVDGMMK